MSTYQDRSKKLRGNIDDIPPRKPSIISMTISELLDRIPVGDFSDAESIASIIIRPYTDGPDDSEEDDPPPQHDHPQTRITDGLAGALTNHDLAVAVALWLEHKGSAAGLEMWKHWLKRGDPAIDHVWRLLGPKAVRLSQTKRVHYERGEPDWSDPKHVLQTLAYWSKLPTYEDTVSCVSAGDKIPQ